MKIKIKLLLLFFFFVIQTKSQSISNINMFQKLIDTSVTKIKEDIKTSNKIKLIFTSPENLSYLKSQTYSSFSKIKIISDTADFIVEYNISVASVKYENMEKKNLFGDFTADRIVELTGTYLIKNKTDIIKSQKFSEKFLDKISIDEVNELENISLPFTQGKIPEEPFFSSLYEPVIAVSAIAISIYLFFSVRSK